MKRSRAISLLLMGTAGLALAACDDGQPIETGIYENVAQCSRDYAPQDCRKSFEEASVQNGKVAPKYASRGDCESDFGKDHCQPADPKYYGGHSGGFMPMMMGYLMGRSSRADDGSIHQVVAQPLYRTFRGGQPAEFRTAEDIEVGSSIGRGTMRSSSMAARAPSVRTTTIARGGFGAHIGGFGS